MLASPALECVVAWPDSIAVVTVMANMTRPLALSIAAHSDGLAKTHKPE